MRYILGIYTKTCIYSSYRYHTNTEGYKQMLYIYPQKSIIQAISITKLLKKQTYKTFYLVQLEPYQGFKISDTVYKLQKKAFFFPFLFEMQRSLN